MRQLARQSERILHGGLGMGGMQGVMQSLLDQVGAFAHNSPKQLRPEAGRLVRAGYVGGTRFDPPGSRAGGCGLAIAERKQHPGQRDSVGIAKMNSHAKYAGGATDGL